MARKPLDRSSPSSAWMNVGWIAGIVAGIVFAAFEMIVAAAMGVGFWTPLRMISGIVLGADALQPAATALGVAIVVGLIVHVVLSALYGAVYGAMDGAFRPLHQSKGSIVTSATLFGFGLWLVNFYIFAPLLFPWFTEANALVQFIGHTFFFGTTMGLIMAARFEPREREFAPGEPVRP